MEQAPKSEPQATRAEILRAAALIAGQCDGAVVPDGAGYNAVDSPVAKSILKARGHTDRQVRTLWSILRKYREQLSRMGVDYAALVPPPLPPRGDNGRFMVPQDRVRLSWVQTRKGRRIAILFANDERMSELLKALRKTPNSPPWFDYREKTWVIPEDFNLMDLVANSVREKMPGLEVEVDQALQEAIANTRRAQAEVYEASRASASDMEVPTKIPLYPFQKAGVEWIEQMKGRALIADEMGLGKTVQALGYLARHPEALPALIVCPATVRANWYKEVRRFTDYRPLLISSKTSLKAFLKLKLDAALGPQEGYQVVVVNYDLFDTETPASWVKRLAKGEKEVIPHLLEAGQYALKALNKAYADVPDIGIKQQLLSVIRDIGKQGKNSNRRKFVKVKANGMPLPEFLGPGFKTLVCDEMHYVKDMKAQRTLAVEQISKSVEGVVGLTGTPILNRPIELWSQVHIVNPRVFPDWMAFAQDHCGAKKGRFGLDVSGATNLDVLERKLRTGVMLRRLKKDVLKELPPLIRITIPLILESSLREYEKEAKHIVLRLAKIKTERDEWKTKLASMTDKERKAYYAEHAAEVAEKNRLSGVAIEEIEALKLVAVAAKFAEAVKFVLDVKEQQGKVVVYMTHHATVDRMLEAVRKEDIKADFIDGRIPGPDREPIKDRFQEGDLEVLVLGIRAAAEGLTLTASHAVVFVEFDWNPAKHWQAEARVDRIGQTVSPTVYYLVALGTIEEKIASLIDSKRAVVNAALGEGERTFNEEGILDAILDDVAAMGAA